MTQKEKDSYTNGMKIVSDDNNFIKDLKLLGKHIRIINCYSMIGNKKYDNKDLFREILLKITPEKIKYNTLNIDESNYINKSIKKITEYYIHNNNEDPPIKSLYTIIYFYYKYIVSHEDDLDYILIDYRDTNNIPYYKKILFDNRKDAFVYVLKPKGEQKYLISGFLHELNSEHKKINTENLLDLVYYEYDTEKIIEHIIPIITIDN